MSARHPTGQEQPRERMVRMSPRVPAAGALAAGVFLAAGVWIGAALDDNGGAGASPPARPTMEQTGDGPRVPPVFGYYGGEEIVFIHAETSDPDIAQTLQGMMGSPVPLVPSLTQVPDSARSPVYVFTNGLTPQETPSGPKAPERSPSSSPASSSTPPS